jgi:hypothetical protein
MSDLVERLRVRRNPMVDGQRAEAADEIERLRRWLKESDAEWYGKMQAKEAELADSDKWRIEFRDLAGRHSERIGELERELAEARKLMRWVRPFAPNDGTIRDAIDAFLAEKQEVVFEPSEPGPVIAVLPFPDAQENKR